MGLGRSIFGNRRIMREIANTRFSMSEMLEESVNIFKSEVGILLLVLVAGCVLTAVCTFPKKHVVGYFIYSVLLLNLSILVLKGAQGFKYLLIACLLYYGIEFWIPLSLFYWIIIGVLVLCKEEEHLNIKYKSIVAIVSFIIICITAGKWDKWFAVLGFFILGML